MNPSDTNKRVKADVGIIMLDTTFPRIKGDIGNPDTFDFPVQFKKVKDASPEQIVLAADDRLIQPFIAAGQELIDTGAKLLTTSCGFLALFHNELNQALDVPVFSSSLLQVHLAQAIIKKDRKIGILTAHKPALTRRHLAAVGIETYNLEIMGMENTREFFNVFIKGKSTLDRAVCEMEMGRAARMLKQNHPDIGAVVLECTNMPPYRYIVRQETGGLPVFDIVTLVNYARSTVIR